MEDYQLLGVLSNLTFFKKIVKLEVFETLRRSNTFTIMKYIYLYLVFVGYLFFFSCTTVNAEYSLYDPATDIMNIESIYQISTTTVLSSTTSMSISEYKISFLLYLFVIMSLSFTILTVFLFRSLVYKIR